MPEDEPRGLEVGGSAELYEGFQVHQYEKVGKVKVRKFYKSIKMLHSNFTIKLYFSLFGPVVKKTC